MRLVKNALAGAMALACLVAGPAFATDDTVTAKNAAGSTVTFCSKDTGSGVMASCNMTVDTSGVKMTPAKDSTLANTQATPGSDAAKANAVQGVTGGKPVGVKPLDSANNDTSDTATHSWKVNCVVGCAGASNTSPASGAITAADSATTTTSGQGGASIVTGTPTASSFKDFAVSGASGGTLTISGTFVATSQIEASFDGGTTYYPSSGLLRGTSTTTSQVTGPGAFSLDLNGVTNLRVRATAYTSGTETVNFTYSSAAGMTKILNPAPAGENHTGEVGGNQALITAALTGSTSPAYSAGDVIGGKMTLSGAARVAAGSGLIQSVVVNSKSAQTTQVDIILFNADPSSSTFTDNAAVAIAAADFDKILGVVHVTDWTNLGTPSVGQAQTQAMPFVIPSGTTLYAVAVARGTLTLTATTDFSGAFRLIRN